MTFTMLEAPKAGNRNGPWRFLAERLLEVQDKSGAHAPPGVAGEIVARLRGRGGAAVGCFAVTAPAPVPCGRRTARQLPPSQTHSRPSIPEP